MKKLFVILAALILLLGLNALGEETARDITSVCKLENKAGHVKKMLDNELATYWEQSGSSALYITIPDDETPGGILIEWFAEGAEYTITQFNPDGDLICEQTEADYFRSIETWFPLDDQAYKIKLQPKKGTRLSEIHIYSGGELPSDVRAWSAPPETADLLLIVAHQDDEELWFGGLLPYYAAVRDETVQVAYMTSCGRYRRAEALKGLWAMGVTCYPEFINLKDSSDRGEEAIENWGGRDNIYNKIITLIRKYKPAAIVTHDENGEYGHVQHILTAKYVQRSIEYAADTRYTAGLKDYGTWQVQKLYWHLSDENTIYMDWNQPSEKLNGRTPLEAACDGFACHSSQHARYNMKDAMKYDYTKFGLVYSLVGVDVNKNDFLENIDLAALRAGSAS